MILIDRLLAGGIGFVLHKLAEAVDAELNSEEAVRRELLACETRRELGELDADDCRELEDALLARLAEIRTHSKSGRTTRGRTTVAGVKIHLDE